MLTYSSYRSCILIINANCGCFTSISVIISYYFIKKCALLYKFLIKLKLVMLDIEFQGRNKIILYEINYINAMGMQSIFYTCFILLNGLIC